MKKRLFGMMLAVIMFLFVLGTGFLPTTAVADAQPVDQEIKKSDVHRRPGQGRPQKHLVFLFRVVKYFHVCGKQA